MSKRYKGGIISATPPTTGATASGEWTLAQQFQAQGAGAWPAPPSAYIEDIFSTYIYRGSGANRTITNGVAVSSGGLVWIKDRSVAGNHILQDTTQGTTTYLSSNTTSVAQSSGGVYVTSFSSSGFNLGNGAAVNTNGDDIVAWSFRAQPKFFDIVTYTGNGSVRTIPHNLQSVPGCIMVKRIVGGASDWYVQHRSLGPTFDIFLNSTSAAIGSSNAWNSTSPTSTVFSLGLDSNVNLNGATYVAYLFAHNAGGFGASGSENIISCGSFTGSSTPSATTLGYEPQWILYKQSNSVAQWNLVDNMRGFTNIAAQVAGNGYSAGLFPNTTGVESIRDDMGTAATGFATQGNSASNTYIYIAIRRGPMKTPTAGTQVFAPAGNNISGFITTNFTVDSLWDGFTLGSATNSAVADRLRGVETTYGDIQYGPYLRTSNNSATAATLSATQNWNNIGYTNANAGNNTCQWAFSRAPGCFDIVCYTGIGAAGATAISHNLTVVPQMMIVKSLNDARAWGVYQSTLANTDVLYLESTQAKDTGMITWGSTTPTSTQFYVGNTFTTNGSGVNYVAYLFATLAGVSKVGSFTGTAALQTINCGFTTGARFVLIRRSDSTGDWYVWDSARGISSGTDPYLLFNSVAAQVTGTNYVDTTSTGFQVTAAASTTVNISAATYIFLAIA